jgi:hypothetical protein
LKVLAVASFVLAQLFIGNVVEGVYPTPGAHRAPSSGGGRVYGDRVPNQPKPQVQFRKSIKKVGRPAQILAAFADPALRGAAPWHPARLDHLIRLLEGHWV